MSHADQFVELNVETGDCLIKICRKWLQYPEDWPKIAELNNIKNPNLIHPNDKVIVPIDMLKGIPLNGVITFVQGDVKISKDTDQTSIPVHLNDSIREGSRITTGNDGSVRVSFQDGYAFVIRSNTNLRIIQANTKRESRLFFQLWMGIGRVLSRIKKATGADARFQVETPSAVAAVRGTEFRASVDTSEDTRCEVLQGSLSLKANEAEVQVKEGEGSLVRKGEAPSAPSELLPPPEVTIPSPLITHLPVELEFENIEGAFRYRIMIAADPDFHGILRETMVEPRERFRLDDMADGAYFLRAGSIDRAGIEGIDSVPVEFRIRVHPRPPVLSWAQGDRVFKSGMVHFSWAGVPQAKKYRIQVRKGELLQVFDKVITETTQPAFEFQPAAPSVYQVRIRSIAEDDYEGLWSNVSSFRVVPPPPEPAIEPMDKKGNRLRITSPAVADHFRYEFQISKDPRFQEIIVSKTTEVPEIILEKPEDPGTYYVRASLHLPGFQSDFSPSAGFEVKEESALLSAVLFAAFVVAIILPASLLF
ncbi:MAG: FecR domain-containing protein [Deltaproteobacteria bacterium]|nr:FecR domain-containing protein [Deltaproteobacteria bacterium]